jgi:translocation and assembly module TamB
VDATAATSAGVMRINGRSNFQNANVVFEGAVAMHDRFPANLKLTMDGLDVDPLLKAFLKGRVTGHSAIGGVLTLSGPLRDPRLLTVNGDINRLTAEVEHMHIENDGPLRFSVADQVLRLDEFHLKGEDTTLGATGTIALAGPREMNLRGEGHVQLKLLQSFNADFHSSGVMDFNLVARGTLARPILLGRATITKGALTNINFPNGLNDVNGTLVFNQDRMQIQSLTATSGGGNLTFSGFVTYGNGISFNLSATGKNVRLRYPQGMSSTIDADLRLTGSSAAATAAGTVTVTRFSMSPQFDIATFIARSKQAPEVANPASALNNLRLAVRVTSTPDLQVTTTLAKVSGDVDFNLRGTAARPVMLGRINITEGQVTFNGTTYQMDRGDVSFTNPVRIEPVVDMEMTTRVRDYDITLGFHGPGDRLSMTYRSDPPLPTADIISLLAFGTTREESVMATGPNPTFSESASNAILGQALSSAQNSRVQRLLGVSRVKIAPEVGGAESNPNARVTIEQQVSKNFTVTYITDLTHTASQQQIIQVEYNYSRSISVLASRDQYGIVSFDVRIRQRRK